MTAPTYRHLLLSGELSRRIDQARALLAPCQLCPHLCRVDRSRGQQGVCRMGQRAKLSSWNLHGWEEPPISGTRGSGTLFFSGCSGRCLFCQNYPISQMGHGIEVTAERLAGMMLELQRKGAHNINFVTPTHFVTQILEALPAAISGGLRLPLVWNSSGYERAEVLRLLDGIIDIWLPDSKYADDAVALRLSGFSAYVSHNRAALKEMHRQVGDALRLDELGLATRGMIVRHLVLPDGLAGTDRVMRWIADELSPTVHVSLMDQYFPAYGALEHPVLNRKTTLDEYEAALGALESAGLENGWYQTGLAEELDQADLAVL